MRPVTPQWRLGTPFLMGIFVAGLLLAAISKPLCGQDTALSEEEKREQVAAERFLDLLLQRPVTGTALERVFGFHVSRGSLTELLDELHTKAEQAATDGDQQKAGNHWMVIGLLQLQRGEEAAAAKALASAEAALKDNPLAAYHHGQALLLVGKNDAAAEAMQRAIDLKPSRRDYLTIAGQLGRLHQRAGNADAAMKIWRQLEESFPGDDGVRHRIARAMAEEGDAAGALKRYDALAEDARSQNDRIVFALRAADLRLQLGQKEKATDDLEILLGRLRPGSYLYAEARRRIENAFLNSGDYAGLAGYYEAWIKEHPDDVGAVLRLARTLSVQGRGPEAVKWLVKAIERSPTDTAARLTLIDAYIAEELYADAAAQYEQLAAMEPANPDHLVRWGQVLLEDPKRPKEQRKEAAAEVWKRLAEARSDDAVIQSQVADLLRGAELTEEALTKYRKAIELAPAQPQYKEYLGEYLHRMDRHEEALPVWRSIAEGKLRTRENLVRLAEVLHQFDEPKEAVKVLGEACELDPTIDERLRYAEWLRDASSFEEALEQLRLAGEQTDTVDDRDRVFAAAVQTYQAAGQLEERIKEARQLAEKAKNDGELWRRLAVLCDANRQTRESFEAIEKAIEYSGDSIETLDVAARMYESAGRLQDAVEKRRMLADTDLRFRSGHLQRLASLHLRMGHADEAIAAGKELLAAGRGSIESFRFYADLCGQVGREDERLDTLRRCLRVNPRSSDAQQMLATQLAEDFKTDQAIELYWKMLDSADDLEARRGVVTRLSDLYLRSNRLDQLISRLEIRGRESGERRTTIDLTATAYEQAGDLGLAREALAGLLREQGRDTLLLERLVALAEKAGETETAIELQRQLLRLAPGRQNEARLASLLIDIGALDEAEALWLRLSEQTTDAEELSRNINRLFTAGETKIAIQLAEKALAADADNWEVRLQLMVLQGVEGQWKAATESAKQLRNLDIEDTTLPVGGKPYRSTFTLANGQTYEQPPLKLIRTQRLYDLYLALDERYSHRSVTSLPRPMDFGHAKLMALWVLLKYKHSEGDLKKFVDEAESKATAAGATADDVRHWYETISIASNIDHNLATNWNDPDTWSPLWKLVDVDDEMGVWVLTRQLLRRSGFVSSGRSMPFRPLSEERLQWLKAMANDDSTLNSAMARYDGSASWASLYDTELRIANREKEADAYSEHRIKDVLAKKDSKNALSLLQHVSAHGDDDQLWEILKLLRDNPQDQTALRAYGSNSAAFCLNMFASQQRIDKELSKGPADATYRDRIIQLLDTMIAEHAQTPVRRSSIHLTNVGGTRRTHVRGGHNYQEVEIPFPPEGLGPDEPFIVVLWTVHSILKDHDNEWMTRLLANSEDAEPRERILRHVLTGSVLQWMERTGPAIKQIAAAVELAAAEVPTSEPELRLMWADLLLRQNQKRQALEVIEALSVYDQNTMAVREFAAAKLAAVLGDRERARLAAKRLFGVRLDTNTQIELAKLMRTLDMRELATDLVRRMRSRGGSNTDQLSSLMTYFVAQNEKEQAAEVAMELLRRSVPGRRQSSSSMTATQARRRSALQTLANVGRLTALIEATEERLKHSPKSQRIRGELAEMYVSAGKTEKAQQLLAGSDSGDVQSTAALQQAAKQFVAAGKMDEACDAYLKVLRRKPELFRNDYYELKQPFERKKRLGDLADLIVEVGLKKFEMHRVGELCREMVQLKEDQAKVKKLFFAILEVPPTTSNAVYSLNNVVSYSSKIFEDDEVVAKIQDYLIRASLQNTSDWGTLFQGYSTSSGGRHRNAAMNLVETVGKDEKRAQALEDLIRKTLKENENWYEGRAWLGTLLVVRKRYDEATKLLEPLLAKDMKPVPTFQAFWLIGSLIDSHTPMKPLAMRMYRHSLEHHATEIYQYGSEFEFSLANRACQLLLELGNKEEARDLVLTSIAESEKKNANRYGNEEYEAYRKIRGTTSIIEFLEKLGFPTDALRMCRNFDMSLFEKAGRYERGGREKFEKKRDELMEKVRKLGGLATAEAMIEPSTSGPAAVDLGITIGERPFTSNGLQSLWIEMVEQAGNQPAQAKSLKSLTESLAALREKRPKDDSVAFAHAFAADITGDPAALRKLVTTWTDKTGSQDAVEDLKLRQRILVIAALHFARTDNDEDRQFVEKIAFDTSGDWSWENRVPLLAGLGRLAVERGDKTTAKRFWDAARTSEPGQLTVLDLAQAAAEAGMLELSYDAAAAAGTAPAKSIGAAEPTKAANSLGDLLGSARSQSPSRPSGQDEPDAAEIRLAKRLLELDDVWLTQKAPPRPTYDALRKIVLGRTDAKLKPLCLPVEVLRDDDLKIDSVFDRLACRAKEAKQTDHLVSLLAANDEESHLFSGLARIRNGQSDAALKHYAAVEGTSLKALPKEAVIQTLLPALDDVKCRRDAIRIGLTLVDLNKPTQRYQSVRPFDSLSFQLAERAIHNGNSKLGFAAINDFLELTQHDNDRYSGDSGISRRVEQLNRVCKILQNMHLNDALRFAAMRQPIFAMGYDRSNDWVGGSLVRRIYEMKDRKKAYTTLADWTLAGDGPLRVLHSVVQRQPLPDWIPASVSGDFPQFPPLASDSYPILTSWYVLARLAQEMDSMEELLERLGKAHEESRSGADVAMAIALAVSEQPIPGEVLKQIDQRMTKLYVEYDKHKTALPLPTIQLATMLATSPDHREWAKRTAFHFVAHGQRSSRSFFMSLHHRFQHQQGWLEPSGLSEADNLAHWLGASFAGAGAYTTTQAPPIWVTDGASQVSHVCGIGKDRLWLRYPLEGDFEFHVELSDGSWSESVIIASGIRFDTNGYNKSVRVWSDREGDRVSYPTGTIKAREWNRYTVSYKSGILTYSVNDTPIYKEPQRVSAPWIALQSLGECYTHARNIRITGKPRILTSVNLLASDDMRGWSGFYYGQPLPTIQMNNDVQEPGAEKPRRYRTAPTADRLGELAWTVKDGELISGNAKRRGPEEQSLIRYGRPLGQGETLSYEFFYEAGKTAVHPSIGRTAYILRPDGIRRHWMTESGNTWKTPHDYEVPVQPAGAATLPLKEGAWNHVTLRISDNKLQIRLNDTLIFDQPVGILHEGPIFGFFHYAAKTKARVRNIVLSGPWPETLPKNLLELSTN